MKARGAIFREIGTPLSIEEVDISDPRPNEVLVRTLACGVCHSDLHFVNGSIAGPSPTIPGHEPAGIVEAVGSDVRTVAVGDHVIACTSMFCGQCTQCLKGRPYLCMDRGACRRKRGDEPRIAQAGKPLFQFADLSGFCEVMLVHERALVKIDNDIPLDRAALVGCAVTTGVGAALNTAKVEPGSTVAVFGAGGVGSSIIQGARIAGAKQIIAIDVVASKLDAAKKFGATDVILSGGDVDPVKAIKKLSKGGVDFAFDAVGMTLLSQQCFYALAPKGKAVIVGAIPPGQKLELEPGHFFVEKTITGCFMGSNRFHIDALSYLDLYRQDKLDLDAMITERMPLSDINKAFELMEQGEVTRTVITFD
ncbi:MAG: Zn-dependent alcohol dehydrogenase [Pseudomonadales bacterium]|nr:Zn-dependent alcohol dehydrogenase [Pseudomonadales bacterium]